MPSIGPILRRVSRLCFAGVCSLVFAFLLLPMLAIVPLSFNTEPYFSFPIKGFTWRWYGDLLVAPAWRLALLNSLIVGVCAALLATLLATPAAFALARPGVPGRNLLRALFVGPLAVPIIIVSVAIYFLYARIGLTGSLAGLVLAHTTIAVPFVLVSVSVSLDAFDWNLLRAAGSLGANGWMAFRRVTLPLIAPGIVSGAIFAFAASFDDVVLALFLADAPQWTLPRQMWSGVRENIDPTILAAGTLLSLFSVAVLAAAELLRRSVARRHGAGGNPAVVRSGR